MRELRARNQTFLSVAGFESFARALTTIALSLCLLLAALDRGLHVAATLLQLSHDPFRSHHALELLDCTLDAALTNFDFDGFALNWIASHGSPFQGRHLWPGLLCFSSRRRQKKAASKSLGSDGLVTRICAVARRRALRRKFRRVAARWKRSVLPLFLAICCVVLAINGAVRALGGDVP